jgi:phage regulator Rha-like protein
MPLEEISDRILLLRGQRVLLDVDLAVLYGVETRRLNEQVRRNNNRFPADFIFELNAEEASNLKSQNATSSWGGTRKRPMAYTEHGAIMAAAVLKAPRAVEVSVYVVRAFVHLRRALAAHGELAEKIAKLEAEAEKMAERQDVFGYQLKQVFETIRQLIAVPEQPKKQPIGFVVHEDRSTRK